MTAALIPLAASSLLALSAAAPSVTEDAAGRAPAPQAAAPQVRPNTNLKPHQGPAAPRPSAARTSAPRTASTTSTARTPPERSSSSSHTTTSSSHTSPTHTSPTHTSATHTSATHTSRHSAPPPASARGGQAHTRPHSAPPPRSSYSPYHVSAHQAYAHHYYRGPHYSPAYWGAGVFVYAPPPPPRQARAGGRASAPPPPPPKEIDRDDSFSLGVRAGTFQSGYTDGASYGDFGLGVAARYRPIEAVGVEVAYTYFNDQFDSDAERVTQPLSTSVELFAFPWTRVSPYVLGGVTWTKRSYDDTYSTPSGEQSFKSTGVQFGPHAGLGLEIAVGKSAAIDLEGRYNMFVTNDPEEGDLPGALQGTVGLNLYF